MTVEEFVIAVVDKELKLVNANVSACDVLYNNAQNPQWFNTYFFKTVEQFVEWRSYCYQLMRRYKSRLSKRERYDLFNILNLQYGLRYDFDYELIPKYEKYKIQLKKNSKNSEECISMS